MKKTGTLLLSGLMLTHISFGQSVKNTVKKADSLYNVKNYAKSFEEYKHAIEMGDTNFIDLYNGACSASRAGEKSETYKWLDLSVKYGWTDVAHLKIDSDLIKLHSDSLWSKLVTRVQNSSDSIDAHLDKPLEKELMSIWADDQNPRDKYEKAGNQFGWHSPEADSFLKTMRYNDSIDLIKVTKILDENGWVGKDKVGNANEALWLVIQHADLNTQEKYLPMVREAVKAGKVHPSELALLEDRVALREGKRQIYGSQITRHDTIYCIAPLDDPDNVDKRRAEVGLGPLAEYVKNWNIVWNVEEYKKQLPEIEKNYKKW